VVLWRKQAIGLLLVLLIPFASYSQTPEPVETIRVESDLVDLKVNVVSLNPQGPSPELQQKDFRVLEDGQPQDIAFFAAADAPFDLVLLLDLSGSSKDKLKLIRKSARRFIEATRPADRVSIVAFTDVAMILCPLTQDRRQLAQSLDLIKDPVGGTRFWDALRYVLAILNASRNVQRRSAVVVLTDGVDNALPDINGPGSQTSFPELLSIVRASESMVFPIYLDTEHEQLKHGAATQTAYALAREQLALIAEAGGSTIYRAEKLKDLDEVYRQVIADLARIYSIGYRPSNALKDGKWRSVSIQIQDRQDVVARTRQGYFSKTPAN
jgi:VWFA-related protein